MGRNMSNLSRKKYAVLEKFGISKVTDPNKAYQILIDSLALIVKNIDESNIREALCNALTDLGLPSESLHNVLDLVVKDITDRVRKVSYRMIVRYQFESQRLIESMYRKRIAAYFTKPFGTNLMSELTSVFVKNESRFSEGITLSDPFMGSGLTLTGAIQFMGREFVKRVWGVELHPLPAITGYSALLSLLDGDLKRVCVRCGDTFKEIWGRLSSLDKYNALGNYFEADVVLTNPPFTRWENLDEKYRRFLEKLIKVTGYSKYVHRKQLSLQVVAMFLIDSVLKDNGLLVSVLPSSTFYTIYGKAIKGLFRSKYDVLALVETKSVSFSTDSGFKEFIAICRKRKPLKSDLSAFITIESENNVDLRTLVQIILDRRISTDLKNMWINFINIHSLPKILDANWLILFGKDELRELAIKTIIKALNQGKLIEWKALLGKSSIVRGVEMYGPDFFLIPNKYWAITSVSNENVVICNKSSNEELELDREYLIPTLRKPSLYTNKIRVKPDHFFISIPPKDLHDLPSDLRKYVGWGISSGVVNVAVRAFGSKWYSHVHQQIIKKNPFGRLFLPDKIDVKFKSRGVFAVTTKEKATATKNFYILVRDSTKLVDILTLWFNSSIFLSLFIFGSRKISETWTRFLEDDYLNMPVPNINLAEKELIENIEDLIDELNSKTLPPLKHQFKEKYRYEIDLLISKILGISNPRQFVERLHTLLSEYINSN